MALADRLKELLEKRDHNIREAAAKAGIGYATMHGLVTGERSNPSRSTLERVADAYGVSVQWLLGDFPDEETPEQAMSATMPNVSFLKPRARALYDRAVGSYLTRGWPQPIIERAAWDLVNYILGANTLRSSGPGKPELTEDEQVMVLERMTEHVERAYGPNGVLRRP